MLWPGIDIDIPTGKQSKSTPQGTKDAVLAACKAGLTGASELVKTNPKMCKVELDNEYVRITRVNVPAHGMLAMHSHPAATLSSTLPEDI